MTAHPSTPNPVQAPHSPRAALPPGPERPERRSARSGRSRAMRRDLAAGVSDLHELAERHRVTRVQMARWAARPRQSEMIEQLQRLADRRTALLIATSRADAALMLRRIALIEETAAGEVTRKACVDLLKLERLAGSSAAPARAARAEAPPREFTDAELNEAMYAFGRDDDEEEGGGGGEDGEPSSGRDGDEGTAGAD